jgi:hypothetical protein
MERNIVVKSAEILLDFDEAENLVVELQQRMSSLKSRHPEISGFSLEPLGEYCYYRLCYDRYETDKEMEKRIRKEKEQAEQCAIDGERARDKRYRKYLIYKKEFEPNLVVDAESMEKVVDRVTNPREPTEALRDLMSQKKVT